MKAVVTGANGFVGRALVRALLTQRHSVTAMTASSNRSMDHPRLSWERFDLGRPAERWKEVLCGADVVYHLAWSNVPSEANLAPVDDAQSTLLDH